MELGKSEKKKDTRYKIQMKKEKEKYYDTRFVAVIKVCSKYLNIDMKSMIKTTIYH